MKGLASFKDTKVKVEKYYKGIGQVYCPYFGEEIRFGPEGLEHLKFKGRKRARPTRVQQTRMKVLLLAPQVLKLSHTLQGVQKKMSLERQKINSRWEKVARQVIYYEFIAVLGGFRMRVIVKGVVGRKKQFWSVIPYWKVGQKHRILHSSQLDVP